MVADVLAQIDVLVSMDTQGDAVRPVGDEYSIIFKSYQFFI